MSQLFYWAIFSPLLVPAFSLMAFPLLFFFYSVLFHYGKEADK